MTKEEGDRKRLLVYSALAVIMTGAALSHGGEQDLSGVFLS